ncbi:MAG: 2-oxoacid:acceptor oxidoreductase family protein [Bacteriovoracaceae bacterium]
MDPHANSIEILNGNELIVQGALEAGFSLYTGYPGSPLADYFNVLFKEKKRLEDLGAKVVIANSEANAAAMASGAKQANRDCLVAMKSMGLHVAADALSVGNFANPGDKDEANNNERKAGVVIVVGDDPWSISTSTAADSRYLFKHLHIPFLEPSNPQELKDWMKVALEFSRKTSVYQGLLTTTFMAEGGGRVKVHPWAKIQKEKEELSTENFDLSQNVMVPPNSLIADTKMINERFPKVLKEYERLNLDRSFGNFKAEIGIISAGVIFESVKHVLEENEWLDSVNLYKLAGSYPLVKSRLLEFLKPLKALIIVEEKRGFLESEIKSLIQGEGLEISIYGKTGYDGAPGLQAFGGLSFEMIQTFLKDLFKAYHLSECPSLNPDKSEALGVNLPKRLPTFCPGCPHRETLSLLKDLRARLKDENIDLVSHGDVGCYSLSFLPPFKEMHNLSAMGQGGALGAGVDLFSKNPSVVLMGDSTFFHSGMTDISNSVQCGHEITYILLDNDNTAMTGHQMTPRSGVSVDGRKRPRQDMYHLVKSLGVETVLEVNPSDRYFYRSLLYDYVKKSGVKVIISNKECGLTFQGRVKAKERELFSKNQTVEKKDFYHINTSVCEDCRACVEMTGCPGLTQTHDAYGTKVQIDPQICVGDSYCTKIKACPSFELVEVLDYHPTKYQKSLKNDFLDYKLAEPKVKKALKDIKGTTDWRCVVTGVGGSGVTTISRVLANAALEMQGLDHLDFKFVDQKGLAQRNGNVTGHMAIYEKGRSFSVPTPLNTADLYVSPDLLDGSTHLRFVSKDGLVVLDNDYQTPLTLLLDNAEEAPTISQESLIQALSEHESQSSILPIKKFCRKYFGKDVYASVAILGAAYQLGHIPFEEEDLKNSIKKTVPKKEVENNLSAFTLGRAIVQFPDDFKDGSQKLDEETNLYELERSVLRSVLPWQSKNGLIELYRSDLKILSSLFEDVEKEYLAQYLHDLYVYDHGKCSDAFIEASQKIHLKLADTDLKKIALRVLAKTFFIKDEVFVAHIMTSGIEKRTKDKLYKSLGRKYKVRHINRPQFDIFGRRIEFDINPKDWMLNIMRFLRPLREVLPAWHRKERSIAEQTRQSLMEILENLKDDSYQKLMKLDNIKGYRDVRYKKANEKLK